MTSTIASEVSKRRRGDDAATVTLWGDFTRELRARVSVATHIQFPSPIYQKAPVAFFRDILGVEPWTKQTEIIEAVRDFDRVAVCSGHKVSKSHSAAGLALWWYASFADARCVMSSTTSRQVDQILWRQLRMMRARSGRCVRCVNDDPSGQAIPAPCEHSGLIDGELGELARTGLKSHDFREIVGFTAREAEAVAGISGSRLLYILDEASGIPDVIFEAIEGNCAGGAKVVLFGNGTRNEGEFYEAFNSKSAKYKTLRISSEETPNVVQRRVVIPGLATYEWIEAKKEEWGEDSSLYKVRVKGLHATHEDGKIFSIHLISMAEQRWSETPEAGRLFIGIDPAGETGTGDESCFAGRRGLKQLFLRPQRGLNAEQHLMHLLRLIEDYGVKRETPVVVIDREGSIGAELFGILRAYTDANPQSFELVGVRASSAAVRQPGQYDRMRDELVRNLELWIRDGGAILEDEKLERELHAFEYRPLVNGKYKVTPKELLKKMLGRSPDRFDATALSVWEPLSLRDDVPDSLAQQVARESSTQSHASTTFDPYAGADAWRS